MSICKRLLCVLLPLLLLLVVLFPVTAKATGNYPTINDYRFVVEYDDKYLLRVWSPDYNNQLYAEYHDIGETASILVSDSASRVRYNFYLLDYVEKYSTLIKNATNAWIQVTCEIYLDQGGNLYSSVGNGDSFWYFTHDGNINIASHSLYNGFVYGECMWSPFDLGALLKNQDLQGFEVGIEFENTLNTNNQYLIETFIRSFTATIYLQGVNGTDADQFIVISNGLTDIESAVNNVRDEVKKMQGQLDHIDDSINQGFDNVTQKQDTIIDKITSGFANIGNQVKKAVTDAVTELFVPSEEDMVAQYDKWDTLMADRFGAVYESSQIIDGFVDAIQVSDTQETIEFPVVSLDIVGTTFEFGGWEVDIIPDGFQWLVDILKLITNIGCTVLFVNGMRSRYESVVK